MGLKQSAGNGLLSDLSQRHVASMGDDDEAHDKWPKRTEASLQPSEFRIACNIQVSRCRIRNGYSTIHGHFRFEQVH